MAQEHDKETVYAVPEFWVCVYRCDSTVLYSRNQRYTQEMVASLVQDHPDFMFVRATWKHREALDGVTASQAQLVWSQAAWWRDNEVIWENHGVRPSVAHKGLLAYYQSPEKACRGILTPIKVGRYLGKFFSAVLSESERARMAKWQETGAIDNTYDDEEAYPLAFAKTRDEIREVYEKGPRSCMSEKADEYDSDGVHPCEVYAAGDLAIAYLTDNSQGESDDNKIRARALVWPEKKVFGRVYPTDCNYAHDCFVDMNDAQAMQDALRNRLLAQGFTFDSFSGAKLLRIETDSGNYVMPYLDGGYQVIKSGKYFVMRDSGCGDFDASNTNGFLEEEENEEEDDWSCCDRCSDRMDDDYDQYTVYVRVNSNGGFAEQTWCSRCENNYAFRCEGFEETFSDDDVRRVEVNGSTYTERYADNNFTKSGLSGEYLGEDTDTVDVDGETWSQEEFDAFGFTCAISDVNYHVKFRHSQYPEIHADCEDADIAVWLEKTPIHDDAQKEIVL